MDLKETELLPTFGSNLQLNHRILPIAGNQCNFSIQIYIQDQFKKLLII